MNKNNYFQSALINGAVERIRILEDSSRNCSVFYIKTQIKIFIAQIKYRYNKRNIALQNKWQLQCDLFSFVVYVFYLSNKYFILSLEIKAERFGWFFT